MSKTETKVEKKNYLTGLKEAIFEEMHSDPDMVCIGEDIGNLGGAFGVTDGLLDEFGKERVIDAPISEALIVGAACGMCLNGKKVMVEMQFIDFISCGFDQIVNMTATFHYRTAGKTAIPMVIRGPAGGYGGGALYHSQMNEAWFANSPGLKIVCPSTPTDAKGLLKASLQDPNPVIFYEIKELYRRRKIEEELAEGQDAYIPLGKARIAREGSDVTIVTYGNNVWHCLEAAKRLKEDGLEAEVVDIRTLVPLDEETILQSLRKTNRIVAVNEAPRTCGFAGEVLARFTDMAFELLDAPPTRVTRLDTPVPWAKPLETEALPSVDDIYETALRTCRY